jgi:hypothetical protein
MEILCIIYPLNFHRKNTEFNGCEFLIMLFYDGAFRAEEIWGFTVALIL